MMGKVIQLVLGMLMVSGLLIGCQWTNGQTEDRLINDAVLTTAIKSRMAEHQRSSLNRVKVETTDGKVQLSGVVDSQEAKSEAARVAKQVKGVKGVDNEIEVQGP